MKKNLLFALGLAVLCLWTYSNCLKNDFLLDDVVLFLSSSQGKFYLGDALQVHFRPVAYFIFIIFYFLFRENVVGYHVFGLLFFYGNCLLLFKTLSIFLKDVRIAMGAVILFAVHPMNVMMTSYVTGSIVSLYTPFMLISILTFWTASERKNRWLWCASLLSFCLAVLCHELALFLPFYLVAILLVFKGQRVVSALKDTSLFWCIIFVYFLFRIYYASLYSHVLEHAMTSGITLGSYFATLGHLIFWYISKLFFPLDITWIYSLHPLQEKIFLYNFIFFVCVLCVFWGLRKLRQDRGFFFFALLFFVGFIPAGLACFTMPFLGLIIEPHWFYFSSVGFYIFVARFFVQKTPLETFRARMIVFCFFVFCCVGMTRQYHVLWKNQKQYCEDWLRICPNNPSAFFYLGEACLHNGDYREAQKFFEKSFLGTKLDSQSYANLGLIAFHFGDYEKALVYLEKALKIKPAYALVYNNLGLIFLAQGQETKAEAALLNAIKIEKQMLEPRLNLAKIYKQQGRIPEAIQCYRQNLAVNPWDVNTLYFLTELYLNQNEFSLASDVARKALVSKADAQKLVNLGSMFAMKNMNKTAASFYQEAYRRDPTNVHFYLEFGKFHANQGRWTDAILLWRKGFVLYPHNPEFSENLQKAEKFLSEQKQ